MTEKEILKTHRRAHREYLAGKAPQVHVQTDNSKAKTKKAPRMQSIQPAKSGNQTKKELIKKPDQGLKQTDLVAFNHGAEQAFISLLTDLIRSEQGVISYREAVREVAFELNISIKTAQTYLEKHSARRAEFSIADGNVRLRETPHEEN